MSLSCHELTKVFSETKLLEMLLPCLNELEDRRKIPKIIAALSAFVDQISASISRKTFRH